jgi:hypothetical protein
LKGLALVGSEALAEPAFVFALADLDASPGETLSAGGERFYAPKLLPQSDELDLLNAEVLCVRSVRTIIRRNAYCARGARQKNYLFAGSDRGW